MTSSSPTSGTIPGTRPYVSMNNAFSQRTPEVFSTHLLPHLKPDFHILDIGCGPGSITIGLANLVPRGHVIGLDVSSMSLKEAREAAESAKLQNIEFVQGDVYELSAIFKSRQEKFDVIHMHQSLLYFPSPVQRLREMRQLLKEGGILASRDSCELRRYPDDEIFQRDRADALCLRYLPHCLWHLLKSSTIADTLSRPHHSH